MFYVGLRDSKGNVILTPFLTSRIAGVGEVYPLDGKTYVVQSKPPVNEKGDIPVLQQTHWITWLTVEQVAGEVAPQKKKEKAAKSVVKG